MKRWFQLLSLMAFILAPAASFNVSEIDGEQVGVRVAYDDPDGVRIHSDDTDGVRIHGDDPDGINVA